MSAISELRVRSEAGAYRVRTGPGAFGALLDEVPGSFLVVDDHFAGHPSIDAERAVFLHATEDVKTLGGAETVIVGLRERGARRGDRLVAVGGGIVQDVATLAAQLYMRGLAWSFVPTTLLAMADSCIGGKSSINVGPYKNLAGSFHPPDEVVVDPVFLQTLPDEDLAGGLAEALKITYCRGPEAFARHLELAAGFPGTAAPLIHHALESKRWFIEIDEFDRAERRLLNFGHTFGHALEAATGFGVSHGIAVALGVVAAERFAVEQGYGPGDEQLRAQAAALAARAPDLDARVARLDEDAFARAFLADKKHGADGLHLILPVGDGVVAETVVPREEGTMPAARRALTAAIGTVVG